MPDYLNQFWSWLGDNPLEFIAVVAGVLGFG
jgi:hypothetical protein